MTDAIVINRVTLVFLFVIIGVSSGVYLGHRQTAHISPAAVSASTHPEILQLMTPARRAELATFDLDHKRALQERDRAIERCEKRGLVAAIGFGMSVVCVRGEESVIHYPEYPVLDP